MFLSTASVPLVLIALIGDATGLSTFDRLTASEQLAAAFYARRMAPSEADQKCIDETRAMFGPNSDEDGNVTESKLKIAQDEAGDLCDGYFVEYSYRNVTTGEGTVNETTTSVLETGRAFNDFVGCDHIPIWEEECINAGGFVGGVPDLDTRCLIGNDAPPNLAGAIITSSLRGFDDCFAASCESTVQKLQSGMFDDILGLPMLAGTIAAIAECEITLVDDQVPDTLVDDQVPDTLVDDQVPDTLVDDQVPDDTTTSSAISMTANYFRVGGIFLSLVALVMI